MIKLVLKFQLLNTESSHVQIVYVSSFFFFVNIIGKSVLFFGK